MVQRTALPGSREELQAHINTFLEELRPHIKKFLSNASLPTWLPLGPGIDEPTQEFYEKLGIPSVGGNPNLLLHQLGDTDNQYVDELFQGNGHK